MRSPTVQFNSFFGFQNVLKKIDMMSPYDFVRYQLELDELGSKSLYTPKDLQPGDPQYNPIGRTLGHCRDVEGIDWQDKMFRTSPLQHHSLSLAGENDNTKFNISTSFYDQQGVML